MPLMPTQQAWAMLNTVALWLGWMLLVFMAFVVAFWVLAGLSVAWDEMQKRRGRKKHDA